MSSNNASPQPAANGNGTHRSRNGGRSTPEDGNKRQGNPSHKKNWPQRPNSQEAPLNGGANGVGQDHQRPRKERYGNGHPNGQNGDRAHEARDRSERGGRRRRDKEFNNQAQVNNNQAQNGHQAQQPEPAQNSNTVHNPPNVDQQRIAESQRINALLSNPSKSLSPEEIAMVKNIAIVVPDYSEADIYEALQQNNFDQTQTVAQLTDSEARGVASWSEVVKKQRSAKDNAPSYERQDQARYQQRQYDRQQQQHQQHQHDQRQQQQQQPIKPRQQNGQQYAPQQHVQQHPQQQHVQQHQQHIQQQHAQQQHAQQQHAQHQHAQQQMQQHMHAMQQQQIQQPNHVQQQQEVGGEELLMGLSKTIEIQLAEIAEKTRMLLQMKTELETIHSSGEGQLTKLQKEKQQLLQDRDRLKEQLRAVEDRLVVVDVGIDEAEREKMDKLKDLQRKSTLYTTGRELVPV